MWLSSRVQIFIWWLLLAPRNSSYAFQPFQPFCHDLKTPSTRASSSNLHASPHSPKKTDPTVFEVLEKMEGDSSRRMFFASSLVGAGLLLGGEPDTAFAQTLPAIALPERNDVQFLWQKDPINPKRSSFKVTDAEKRYNVSFVTYLSRFLLNFDPKAQQWWIDRAKEIPKSTPREEIFKIRQEQFARFAASVDVGLQQDDYVGKDGPRRLLQSLLSQFGAQPTDSGNRSASDTASSSGDDQSDGSVRETKEARRQLALLFGLLKDSQPTREITMLLASIDNGSIDSVEIDDDARSAGLLRGFSPEDKPKVAFPPPPAGSDYDQATASAILKPNGQLLRIEIVDGGDGYKEPPDVSMAIQKALFGIEPAVVDVQVTNGVVTKIKLTDTGFGYVEDRVVETTLDPPSGGEGSPAKIRIVPEMEITKIELQSIGSGYAVEKPVRVTLVPPVGGEAQAIGVGYPKGKMGSFIANRNPGENKIRNFERALINEEPRVISGASSGGNLPPSPFPDKASSSQQLLALLPQGFGLEFDAQNKYYVLSVDKEYQKLYPAMALTAGNRPMVPDFGPRGRNPIERDQSIDVSTFLRFCLSGAVCASGVNLLLTPLDLVKTKVQIDPERYPKILPSFQTVWKQEGPSTFFTGWLPTLTGHFVGGGVLYGMTEVIRRYLTEAAGSSAMSLEVPIILAAASIASAIGAALYCPFDAVRIRLVAQPDYGKNAFETLSRMVEEEGIDALTNAIPVFVAKQVPYAAVKFTIFDLSTEYLYKLFPLAQEDLKLSLAISLFGGVLAGIAAATVSNPADAVISELKKAKSDQSPQEALQALLDRAGVEGLFKGLSIRMVLYSTATALQFLVYDGVRFGLGIGPDDLRLYLDVLGEAISTNA